MSILILISPFDFILLLVKLFGIKNVIILALIGVTPPISAVMSGRYGTNNMENKK